MIEIAFSIPAPLAWIVGVSAITFIVLTVVLFREGVFDGSDLFGLNVLFATLTYAVLWLIPSLLAWAIWATWFN